MFGSQAYRSQPDRSQPDRLWSREPGRSHLETQSNLWIRAVTSLDQASPSSGSTGEERLSLGAPLVPERSRKRPDEDDDDDDPSRAAEQRGASDQTR